MPYAGARVDQSNGDSLEDESTGTGTLIGLLLQESGVLVRLSMNQTWRSHVPSKDDVEGYHRFHSRMPLRNSA